MSGRLERAVWLLPVVVCAAMGWAVLSMQGWTLVDDAYITFRYAENLAAGHGLVWNPGERVEGYTNLLWVLLLVPFARFGLDLVIPAAILSSLFACGCVGLLGRIARGVWPGRPLVHLLPGVALAVNPSFAYWSTMGMEGPAFAFFALLGARLLVLGRGANAEGKRRRILAGLALAALSLTRPEGIMVAGVLLLVELCTTEGSWRARFLRLLPVGAIVVCTVGAQLAFRLLYYGDLLPNTFYAKVVPGVVTVGRGAHHVGAFLLKGGFVVLPGLFALRTRGALRPYLLHGYALLLVYFCYLVVIGGDVPYWYRFYLPLLPLPLLGLGEVMGWLQRALGRVPWLAGRARSGVAFATVGALVVALPARLAWPHVETATVGWMHAGAVRNELLFEHFFRWHAPRDSYVAAWAVGMLGYYTPYRILDGWGLNDRFIARQGVSPEDRPFMFGHEKQHWLYVLSARPDFIILPIPKRARPKLPGYELCWPSALDPNQAIYRRTYPLGDKERSFGMPPGMRRTLLLPPQCKVPHFLSRRPKP
jgi:arabinofuranosyltransferase